MTFTYLSYTLGCLGFGIQGSVQLELQNSFKNDFPQYTLIEKGKYFKPLFR